MPRWPTWAARATPSAPAASARPTAAPLPDSAGISTRSHSKRPSASKAPGLATTSPARPAIELNRMNNTDTAAASRVVHQRQRSSSGARNTPPPVPVSPANTPRLPPAASNSSRGGSRNVGGSTGVRPSRQAENNSTEPTRRRNQNEGRFSHPPRKAPGIASRYTGQIRRHGR